MHSWVSGDGIQFALAEQHFIQGHWDLFGIIPGYWFIWTSKGVRKSSWNLGYHGMTFPGSSPSFLEPRKGFIKWGQFEISFPIRHLQWYRGSVLLVFATRRRSRRWMRIIHYLIWFEMWRKEVLSIWIWRRAVKIWRRRCWIVICMGNLALERTMSATWCRYFIWRNSCQV